MVTAESIDGQTDNVDEVLVVVGNTITKSTGTGFLRDMVEDWAKQDREMAAHGKPRRYATLEDVAADLHLICGTMSYSSIRIKRT